MESKPKALPGDAPSREEPKLREHEWDTGNSNLDRFGSPGWVNNVGGATAATCRKCGCELLSKGAIVHADVKVTKGKEYIYRTVTGKEVRSFKPLSCPLFGFDAFSGGMEAKEIGREAKIEAEKVDIRVDETQYKVRQLEAENLALHEATVARLEQLEAENKALRERVDTVTQLDMGELARHLYALAEEAKEKKALESVESKGRVLQIPKELVEVIDVVGIPVEDKD